MTFFRGMTWVKLASANAKTLVSKLKLKSFTHSIVHKQLRFKRISWLGTHKMQLLKGVGAFVLITTLSYGGNHYIKENTIEVYHVYVNQQEVGIVSNPQVVEDFVLEKKQQIDQQYPNVHMKLNDDEISYSVEKAFKAQSDNLEVLQQINSRLKAKAEAVDLQVDGKSVALVKDKETADSILQQIKDKYVPGKKEAGQVSILSVKKDDKTQKSELEQIDFVEKVEIAKVTTEPTKIMDPQEVVKKLQTGDVKPAKYKVQEGDCITCIADKLDISPQVIYNNNPSIGEDDLIQVNDELNVTVLQPELSVKTTEKVIEDQEIQYDTEYVKDDSLREGHTVTLKAGKNGMKQVTFEIIRINGMMISEEMVDEQIITPPITATVKKGTMVVAGMGTGKFAWPVASARVSSGYGMRWGKSHKGVDMISSNRNIKAADNGIVTFAGVKSGYGNTIIIDHQNGYETLYGHMSKLYASKGNAVLKGDKIGYMGSTGQSTGTHLHFEVRKKGSLENPLKYLNK